MKKTMNNLIYVTISLMLCATAACKEEDVRNSLMVSRDQVSFDSDGGTQDIIIETNAEEWKIQNPADWITLSEINGTESTATVTLTVSSKTPEERSATLKLLAGNAEPVEITVTQASSEFLYSISTNFSLLSFKKGGNSAAITITTEAPDWQISSDLDWLEITPSSGGAGETPVTIKALSNPGSDAREGTITITAEYAPVEEISVSQIGEYYPSYNTDPLAPDNTGMTSTVADLASKMGLGWNAGNTLEATGGETAWGNPRISSELIQLVKSNGFHSIRLPCSWNQYLESAATAEIQQSWLNRIKEVVQLCVDQDMYVLLNIHWDGGWLENNVTPARQEENNAKQKAFWEQIATHLRDFDEHLLFASANEPNVENSTQMAVLKSYHQTFIDAVRSTGGKNSYRVLVIQGPSTDIEKTNELMTALPSDEVAARLMAEVHYYTPWNFCGMEEDQSWGDMFYYWGADYHSETEPERNATWGEESSVDALFELMKSQFVSKGIPVILGEFSAMRRSNLTGEALELHLASRAHFHEYVVRQAKANGMVPMYWDNGGTGNHASGIFNRSANTVADQRVVDALVSGWLE